MRYLIRNLIFNTDDKDYKAGIADKLNLPYNSIQNIKLFKKSVDARHGVRFVMAFTFDCDKNINNKIVEPYIEPINKLDIFQNISSDKKIIIAGSGPAGLFCALKLAYSGYKIEIIEKGGDIADRKNAIQNFWNNSILDEDCNIQFGLGGAGTFSDGKLTTGINNDYIFTVFDTFYRFGAHEDIMYSAMPHIGTDVLEIVINNIRKELEKLNVDFNFRTSLCDINIKNDKIESVIISHNGITKEEKCDELILATGHSGRDVFEILKRHNISMLQKPFSMGVRIEHSRELIDKARYGIMYTHRDLGAADYKLFEHLTNGRTVYTFCMCPGGLVTAASSEKNSIVTNGMSYYKRDLSNSNSALLVTVTPEDFGSRDVLAGIEFQRYWERKAYELTGSYHAPVQNTKDFLTNKISTSFDTKPSYQCGVTMADIRQCLPDFVSESLAIALPKFGKKIKGFDTHGIMTAIESRSSSPIRINRDENYYSSVKGIYPCGEGAGYAGGIVSAAIDGLKVADSIIFNDALK